MRVIYCHLPGGLSGGQLLHYLLEGGGVTPTNYCRQGTTEPISLLYVRVATYEHTLGVILHTLDHTTMHPLALYWPLDLPETSEGHVLLPAGHVVPAALSKPLAKLTFNLVQTEQLRIVLHVNKCSHDGLCLVPVAAVLPCWETVEGRVAFRPKLRMLRIRSNSLVEYIKIINPVKRSARGICHGGPQ